MKAGLLALIALVAAAGCGARSAARGPGIAPVALPKAKPEARPHFDEGVRLMQQGPKSYEAARMAFVKATEIDPKLYEAWHNQGLIDARLSRWDSAVESFEKALEVQPGSRATALALGEAYRQTARFKEAEVLYGKWSAAKPEDLELRLLHVQALRDGGRAADALDEVRELLGKDSKNARLFSALGLVYLKMDKHALAESALRRALELGPSSPRETAEAWSNLGLVLQASGRDQEAFAAFEKASDIDAKLVTARLNKAVVYLDCGDYKRALDELERAAKIAPADPEVHVALGVAARGLKKFTRAREAYERALAVQPDYPPALFNLGILYMDFAPDKKKAREYLILYRKVASANDPRRAEALARLKELK